MKILMVGLGSVGQRHLRNIKRMYGEDAEIYAYRVRGKKTTFSDDMRIRDGIDIEDEYNIKVVSDLDSILARGQFIVFITNITSAHIEYALKAARAGCDIFLEKPVSDRMEGLDELIDLVHKNRIILYVGYQNRFHPCISDLKSIIESNELGRVVSVFSEFGERLTTMHTYEDYRTTYMANKVMGGGPMLNLQIHCLDYLQLLFGSPVSVSSIADHSGLQGIDVEDHASSLYRFRYSDGRIIPIVASTDFFQYPPSHILKVVFENGIVIVDFNSAITKVYNDGADRVIKHNAFVRNDMFLAELKDFMNCIVERKEPCSSIKQGVLGLKMVLAAKESAKNGGANVQIC